MNEIRWTDKVYLDNQGNLQYSNNTDQFTQDFINKIVTNVGLARPINTECGDKLCRDCNNNEDENK